MKKLLIVLLFVVFLLSLFTGCGDNGEKFEWSDIELSNMLPEPESERAEIHTNADNELWIDIYKTTEKQYSDYIKACKEQGFSIDSEKNSLFYAAYNQEGFKIDLTYYSGKEEMSIRLEPPMEMSEIQWPTSEIAKLLPSPKSKIGQISWEKSNGFVIYIGNTPISDYNEYVQVCSNAGFNVDYKKGEDYYEAYNETGYRLRLDYKGYNIMFVRIDAPEDEDANGQEENTEASIEQPATSTFLVQIEINCTENLLLSKYDIDVFVDEIKIGTIEHGKSDSFQVELEEGNHSLVVTEEENQDVDGTAEFTVSEDMDLNYEVYCTSDQVEIEVVVDQVATSDTETDDESVPETTSEPEQETEGDPEPESDELEILTVDNCEDLATMLSTHADIDETYVAFSEKYDGRIIEFDGRVDAVANYQDFNTRYDVLVSAGDFDPNTAIGPTFKLKNIGFHDFDYATFVVGSNVHIVAEVDYVDYDHGLFYLIPVSVTAR